MTGVFGGAFDPPHSEHVAIVRALERSGLFDRIVLLPSGNSPHKDRLSPFSSRVKMLRKVFSENDFSSEGVPVEICDVESSFSGRAYSSEVLPILKERYGEIGFIIGGDSLLSFRSWHEPKKILSVCLIFVIPRGEDDAERLKQFAAELTLEMGGNVTVIENVRGKDASSTRLRAAIALGVEAPGLLPEVRETALSEGLYEDMRRMAERVKANLPEKRWKHTCGVVMTGLSLAEKYGISKENAFTACLLHDSMKYAETAHPGVPKDTIGTKVMHAFNGAEEAKLAYGVTDEDTINAIRYHTTGRAGMSDLEKLVYLADVIEPNRDYPGVEEIRAAAYRDLNEGFLLSLKRSYELLSAAGKPIYHLTVDCYNYYFK